jgi:hypothetical protein
MLYEASCQTGEVKGNIMSNFIIKQEGSASVAAEKIWQVRLGAFSFVLGALAGVATGMILGHVLARAAEPRP